MPFNSYSLGAFCVATIVALGCFDRPAVAGAKKGDLIRVDIDNVPAGTKGNIKLYMGGTDVKHQGLDMARIDGQAEVSTGSDKQFNFNALKTSGRITLQFRVAEDADQFEINSDGATVNFEVFKNDTSIIKKSNGGSNKYPF
jgi:hypothetical protein